MESKRHHIYLLAPTVFFFYPEAPNPSPTIFYVVLLIRRIRITVFEAAADGIIRGYVDISYGVRVCKSRCKSCKDGITAINKDHMRVGPLVFF